MINRIIAWLSTEMVMSLIISLAEALSKRTDNSFDDEVVYIIKQALNKDKE